MVVVAPGPGNIEAEGPAAPRRYALTGIEGAAEPAAGRGIRLVRGMHRGGRPHALGARVPEGHGRAPRDGQGRRTVAGIAVGDEVRRFIPGGNARRSLIFRR